MRIPLRFFLFICCLSITGLVPAGAIHAQFLEAPSVNLPLGHFAYTFIERLETRGIVKPTLALRNKPYTRNTVRAVILELVEVLVENPTALSNSEKKLFQKLKGEFHRELKETGVPVPAGEIEKHLLFLESSQENGHSYAVTDLILDQTFEFMRHNSKADSLDDAISFTQGGGSVRGILRESLAFYADVSNTMIKGDDDITRSNFTSGDRTIIVNADGEVFSLEANAYLVIQPKWFRFQFGKDRLAMGPGDHSNLMLSDNAPAFDNLRLDVEFDRLKFTYFHGFLKSETLPYNFKGDEADDKKIAGHRLEFRLFDGLFFSANEAVIYGGRGIEPQYLNPIMIYHVAEQYTGDKDNNTMSFDITWLKPRGVKFYGALFLDDFSIFQDPFDTPGSKWAGLAGAFWVNPFGLYDADLRLEYTRVEPYVYTHRFPLLTYQHSDVGIGSSLKPNSDEWFLTAGYQPSRRHRLAFNLAWKRHGEGDFDQPFESEDPIPDEKSFLGGTVERIFNIGLGYQLETIANQYLFSEYQYFSGNNYENVKDADLSQHFIRVGYRLNY